jgi:hypothetical protein
VVVLSARVSLWHFPRRRTLASALENTQNPYIQANVALDAHDMAWDFPLALRGQ